MKLHAAITQPRLWGLTKKNMRDAGRDAMAAAGLYWHTHFKARHFMKEAFEMYGYKSRSKKWEAEKARLYPENAGLPLVFTGESRALAMAQNRVDANATAFDRYHADVTVSAPHLNFHADEMTRTTPEEDAALEEEFARVFGARLVAMARENNATPTQLSLLEGRVAAGLAA